MTTRLFVTAAAAFVWSAGLLAQAPAPGSSQKSADSRITVTGCVERADQMAGNTATTTVDSLSFVLIKPQADKPTGTSGTVASDTAAQPDRMYRLDGKLEELNPHVGHKVEIAGMVAEAPTAPAGATSATNAPRLKVESIRMLDPTCPR
jgi:hypothetical protein